MPGASRGLAGLGRGGHFGARTRPAGLGRRVRVRRRTRGRDGHAECDAISHEVRIRKARGKQRGQGLAGSGRQF